MNFDMTQQLFISYFEQQSYVETTYFYFDILVFIFLRL